jgi:protease-4
MKSFLKYLLAAIIGSFIALLLIFFVIRAGIRAGFDALADEEIRIKKNSVLVVDLASPVNDRPDSGPTFGFGGEISRANGLADVLKAIDHAKEDDRIKGILLRMSYVTPGLATLSELREKLTEFKSSGKFIVAYGNFSGQRSYYVSSIADEIYLNPAGIFELRGFSALVSFYKQALEKLGIEMQVYYAGKYKGSTEPFRLERLSEENRTQIRAYLSSVYSEFFGTIADARGKSLAEVDSLARNLVIRSPQDALAHDFIDGAVYFDEVLDKLREKVGIEDTTKPVPMVALSKYIDQLEGSRGPKDKVIAVVYAEGTIVDGMATDGSVGGEAFAKEIRRLRHDEKVKAIVLRINSPGGSAMASEVIWREVQEARASKPVIVSMGNLAASGGYFIAAPGDVIVAQPNTLTGSIGVFLIWPNMQELFEDKLGITHDTVTIGRFADLGNPFRAVTPEEAAVFQGEVDRSYRDFVRKVADGRNMDTSAVHDIAQGHIWSGTQALDIGLVDTLGGLEDAIAIAAQRAGLDRYSVRPFPKPKSPFEKLREIMGAKSFAPEWLNPEWAGYLDELRLLSTEKGVMARMMMDIEVE